MQISYTHAWGRFIVCGSISPRVEIPEFSEKYLRCHTLVYAVVNRINIK
jgi:hypothetical protein